MTRTRPSPKPPGRASPLVPDRRKTGALPDNVPSSRAHAQVHLGGGPRHQDLEVVARVEDGIGAATNSTITSGGGGYCICATIRRTAGDKGRNAGALEMSHEHEATLDSRNRYIPSLLLLYLLCPPVAMVTTARIRQGSALFFLFVAVAQGLSTTFSDNGRYDSILNRRKLATPVFVVKWRQT